VRLPGGLQLGQAVATPCQIQLRAVLWASAVRQTGGEFLSVNYEAGTNVPGV
jgi:hypothetical protein